MKIIYTKEDIEKHREYGSVGGKKLAAQMTAKQRQARARKASAARWSRPCLCGHSERRHSIQRECAVANCDCVMFQSSQESQ